MKNIIIYTSPEMIDAFEKAVKDYIKDVLKERKGKIIKDTTTTETNKKLNELWKKKFTN